MVRHSAVWLLISTVLAFLPPPAAADADEIEGPNMGEIADNIARSSFFDNYTNAELTAYLLEAQSLLSADAIGAQVLIGNSVTSGPGTLTASIRNSVIGSAGLLAINQSSGDVNNQANVTAISLAEVPSLNLADVNVRQVLVDNALTTAADTDAAIVDSFNNTTGVVQVNQAAGSLNNQVNALALAIGGGVGPVGAILADAQLNAIGGDADNDLEIEGAVENRGSITNSFNSFLGIAQVTQISGNLNQVGNVLGVSIQTSGQMP